MFEYEKKHKRGRMTFLYILARHGWLLMLIGAGLLYLSWLMYFGSWNGPTADFLTMHKDWYVTVGMLSQWIMLVGISFLFVSYLEANVLYRYYKFMLDEYAVHLHKGLFFIRETTIPYEQISNVHLLRPYHYRLLGISQLDVVTAADKGMDVTEIKTKKFFIPIIDTKVARALARQLLECADKSRKGKHIYEEDEDELDEDQFEVRAGDSDEIDEE